MSKQLIAAAVALLSLSACGSSHEADQAKAIRLNVFYSIADEANRPAAEAVARKLVEASRTDAGCLGYDFLESATTPGEYMIVETWANDSLLDLHSQAPHFREYVPQLQELGEMRTDRFPLDR